MNYYGLVTLIDGNKTFNTEQEKLVCRIIDNELTSKEHVAKLCNNASQKLHALTRVAHFVTRETHCVIMKIFIQLQFGYCPLIWIFCSRCLNNRINRLHERSQGLGSGSQLNSPVGYANFMFLA